MARRRRDEQLEQDMLALRLREARRRIDEAAASEPQVQNTTEEQLEPKLEAEESKR